MTTYKIRVIGGTEITPCPCPALPEGMVVVSKTAAGMAAEALELLGYQAMADEFWDVLEKKP